MLGQLSLAVVVLLGLFTSSDGKPTFTDENNALLNALANVKEDQSPSAELGRLACSDTVPGPLSTTLVAGSSYIRLKGENSSFVRVFIKSEDAIDYEITSQDQSQQNEKAVTIVCTNLATNEDTSYELKLVIYDVNDNVPVFQRLNQSYTTSIDEVLTGTAPQVIIQDEIRVTDADGVDNNILTAVCERMEVGLQNNLSCDGFFSVRERRITPGNYYFDIYAERLNYSADSSFTLVIKAVNQPRNTAEQPTLQSISQNVVVNIRDIQNLPPNIDKDTLSFTMSEDLTPGSQVENKLIRAFDQDTGDPNAIRFELVRNDQDPYAFDNGLFRLGSVLSPNDNDNEYSVPFILNNTIDRELITKNIKSVSIDIKAIEYDPQNRPNRNPMSAQATISVRITDVNDQRPIFNRAHYQINYTELTNILQEDTYRQLSSDVEINVQDADSTLYNTFDLRIISGNADGSFSFLQKTSGSQSESFILYAKEKILDYEVLPNSYQLVLQATDTNNPSLSSTAIVDVVIIDTNDNSPKFPSNSETFFVDEDAPIGKSIGQIFATDDDSGLFGTISVYEIRDISETFRIDNDGIIYLNKTLDFETRERYSFSAIARDSGPNNNQREGTVFVNVVVQNVFDVGPEFQNEYIAQLFEESLDLIPAMVIQAVSSEGTAQQVTYGINSVEPVGLTNAITVDSISGRVSILRTINYKETSNGTIYVMFRATAGGLSTTRQGVITVQDINNFAPVFRPATPNNIYTAQVREDAQNDYVVIKLNVTDEDGSDSDNGIVEFSIQSGANDDFVIRRDTGEIIVTTFSTLDIEETSRYEVTVIARDRGNPIKSATATVIINLLDANNKPPVFDEIFKSLQMHEGDPVDTVVGGLTATDPDSEGIVRYSIMYNTAKFERKGNEVIQFVDATKVVKIDEVQGLIKIAGPIERSVYDFVSFQVLAYDADPNLPANNGQTATASVVIHILADVDERIYFARPWTHSNPVITKTYAETNSFNYQIMTLRATDPTIPKVVTKYFEVQGSDPGDYFEVQGTLVSVKKPIDYESPDVGTNKRISVAVIAVSDDNTRTATATIVVEIQDLNDNAPVFSEKSYTFRVPEDKKYAYQIGKVTATDADSVSYGDVTYYLAGSNHEHFLVYDEREGAETVAVIRVSEDAELDYETLPEYNLQLIAQDNPSGSVTNNNVQFKTSVPIQIIVVDRNDVAPEFSEDLYEFSIIGTKEVGGDVGFVFAADADSGVNGEVTYQFLNGTNNALLYFSIQTIDLSSSRPGDILKQGEVRVRRSLEALADRSVFDLWVQARDGGNPISLTGISRVRITVSKGVQDLKPKWDENLPSRVQINEHSPINMFVAKVTAFPANATSIIYYSFLGAGDALRDYENFNIDRLSGNITVKRDLDFETKSIYNGSTDVTLTLQILATDSANSSLTNQFLLIVEVLDIEDNEPQFTACRDKIYPIPVLTSVYEDKDPGLFVYQVVACDLDTAPRNQITYSWFFDNTKDNNICTTDILTYFRLDEDTGNIYTNATLDRETQSEFFLCIQANQKTLKKKRETGRALGRSKRQTVEDRLRNRTNHDSVLYVKVIVLDVNDEAPTYSLEDKFIKTVILQYPTVDVVVSEAVDLDTPEFARIRYSIDKIFFVIGGKTQQAPTAFTINANDGTISIGTNDYTDYIGGYFDIHVRAEDYGGMKILNDTQIVRVYVSNEANRIRVVFNKPADSGVDQDARNLINDLNGVDRDSMFYKIMSISYHVVSSNQDPTFDRTDVCIVMVRNDEVMSSLSATKRLNDQDSIQRILNKYNVVDPGPCDPAMSTYPKGWESYWWVLVAFAIFIFICCCILIILICILFRQYKEYMDTRKTYLVPGQ